MEPAVERLLKRLEGVSAAYKEARAETERLAALRKQLMHRARWRKGVPVKEIAHRAGVSTSTVANHTPMPLPDYVKGYSVFDDPAEDALVARMSDARRP